MRNRTSDMTSLLEIGLVFSFIMLAVWTPQGRFSSVVNLSVVLTVMAVSMRGRYSVRELGLTCPTSGAVMMLIAGALAVLLVAGVGGLTSQLGPPQLFPWHKAWQYAIWALVQEFILQSVFYVRLESVFGSGRAVLLAGVLFATAHLPSPLLTTLSFVGGLFFCEIFRRYRNIFPLGVIHALLGLTIAARLPDNLLHHMRVGIGYLAYHR
ncbi:MAG: CPBP family intramembrane glutamic endopeptidase [Terriglobales bacterium]